MKLLRINKNRSTNLNLNDKITNILSEILQDEFGDFPYINATHMRRKKHYLEMFNKDTLKIAQELYKTDFETLQYEYESII